MTKFVYRLLVIVTVLGWGFLMWVLISIAQEERITLVSVRFASEFVVLCLALGVGLVILAALHLIRTRSNFKRRLNHLEALSTHLNEGLMLVNARGVIQWHNTAAAPLITHGRLETATLALVKRVSATRRAAMQTMPIAEAGMYAIQVLPLDRRTVAIICRPSQTGNAQTSFYENFIRRIVHDMRNPLAAIIGHAANLSQSPTVEADAWRKSASTIEYEAQRLTRLVDSMLFDARLAYVPLNLQPLDLVNVLEEAVYAQDERAMRDGKTLHMEVPTTPMHIDGDRDLLVRAFENLIDNSLKYSGENGKLTISLDATAEGYLILFEDNGEGIPPEYLPDRIFQPLVRARSQGSGSGLGLSIVRKIIEMHGGTITAESQLGVGTTMLIQLPKQDA